MKRKIRHALATYTVTKDGVTSYETAFRNQVVDIPDDQVERLDEVGATVDPDVDLERPGTMSQLSETASDSEITNWVMGATNEEVEALVSERPVMAARILSAHASIQERFDEQNLHLGGLREIADEFEAAERAKAEELDALLGDDGSDDTGDGDDTGSDDTTLTDEEADNIVTGNVQEVADYIAEHPTSAQAILDAEGRRANAKDEDVRVTITRAAEAAAGFTQ